MKLIKSVILPLLGLPLFTPLADAGTYKWIDKDGSVVYSQHPPAEGPFESIHIKTTPASKQTAPGKQPNAEAQARESGTKQGPERTLQAELEKLQAVRQKNCAIAKQQLKIYTVYKRIQDSDGQAHRITDKERQAGLNEAEQGIKDYCD